MEDNADQQKAKKKCSDEFYALRGEAIQAYALLEQSLCQVFSSLSGTTMEVASIIFFKIVNASTLHEILAKLVRAKHGAAFNLFWNSFLKILKDDISQRRNHIVHWVTWFSQQEERYWVELRPHGREYKAHPDMPPPILATDLVEFVEKCGFFTRLANTFYFETTPEMKAMFEKESPGSTQSWHGIFLQSIVYPPPSNHPLCPQTHGTPPPPSPA